MSCRIRQMLSWLLLLGSLVILLLAGLGMLAPAARASVSQLQEPAGQVVYRAQSALTDKEGQSWQVILFKRVQPDRTASLSLRLVGFLGKAEFRHPAVLEIRSGEAKPLQANDEFAANPPGSNVGQYDLTPIVPFLSDQRPVTLVLPLEQPGGLTLKVPLAIVQEWLLVANA